MASNMDIGLSVGFFILWLVLMIGTIVAGVFVIVAVWKAMKAHESIAASMIEISRTLNEQIKAEIQTQNKE